MEMFRRTNITMSEHLHKSPCNPFFIGVKIGLNIGTCEQGFSESLLSPVLIMFAFVRVQSETRIPVFERHIWLLSRIFFEM